MPVFNLPGALASGASPEDITGFLAANPDVKIHAPSKSDQPWSYDTAGALKAGVTPPAIIAHLTNATPTAGDATALQTPAPGGSPAVPQALATPPTTQPTAPPASQVAEALGQGYTPKQITDFLQQNPATSHYRTKEALDAGYTPDQIVDHLNKRQQSLGDALIGRPDGSLQGIPVLAPIQRGIAAAQGGVANLADDMGFHGAASDLRSRINQSALHATTAGADMSSSIANGAYLRALSDVPSAALEQTLPIAAGIAGGAMTGGAAPGVALAARLGGGAALGAVTSGDGIARARAANNEATPTAGDMALGLLGGAATGAVGSFGLGGVGKVGGAVGQALAHAAGDAAQPELQTLAGSVGTTAGSQNASGADMAASALTGLGSRAGLAAPNVVSAASALTPGSRLANRAAAWNAMAPEDQQSVLNVVAAHQALQDASANPVWGSQGIGLRAAAGTATDAIQSRVNALVTSLHNQGLLDTDGAHTIGKALGAARNSGMALTQDHLDAINDLGLPADASTALKNAAVQQQLLSDPVALRAAQGPFQGMANLFGGRAGGSIVGGLLGGYQGALVGHMIGEVVRPVTRSALGSLGASLDGAMGLQKSALERQADDGRALLNAAGVPVPSSTGELDAAIGQTRSSIAAQRAQFVPPLPPAMQAAAARAQAAQVMAPASSSGGASGASGAGAGASSSPAATPALVAALQLPTAGAATPAGTFTPDTSGLSGEALAQAQRLPDWVWGLGNSLQNALHVSGQARPVNMASEVHSALDSLSAKGWLPDDIATGLRGHQGRVVPQLYELLRNEMLLKSGIDRTADGGAAAGGPEAGGEPEADVAGP